MWKEKRGNEWWRSGQRLCYRQIFLTENLWSIETKSREKPCKWGECITGWQMGGQKIRKTEAECRQSDRQNWTARLSVCLSDSIFDVWRKRGFRRILHCLLMAELCYSQLAPRHRVPACRHIHTHTLQILFHIAWASIAAHGLLDTHGGWNCKHVKTHLCVCARVWERMCEINIKWVWERWKVWQKCV